MYTQDYLKIIGPGDITYRYRAEILRDAHSQQAQAIADVTAAAVRAIYRAGKRAFVNLANFLAERRRLAELQRLDDRTLADIGLDRSMVFAAARGFDLRAAANSNERTLVAANSNAVNKARAGSDAA